MLTVAERPQRTALERSPAFVAYQRRFEDGRQFLTQQHIEASSGLNDGGQNGDGLLRGDATPVAIAAAPPGRRRRARRRRLAGDPRRPDAARARAARRPVRDRLRARRRGRRVRRPQRGPAQLPVRLRAPRRPAPPVGRGLHHAPRRRGQDLRRHAPGHLDAVRGAAARHRRGHDGEPRRGQRRVRRRGRGPGRRRDQADRDHVPVTRRGAGRELPQDDGRDGHGHPGHPDQARRPPAQHAHARRDAQAEADREGQGDPRDLRAARAPPRHPRHQVGARGPRVRDAAPAQVPGDQGPGQPAARGARALRGQGRRLPGQGARGARHPLRDLGPGQALLLDLLEDDPQGPRVQRDLRPDGDARDRRQREGLLRRRRRHPFALEAAPGPLQGHGGDAEVQHVPGAAHDRDRARGAAAGDPDPHQRHARDGRVRRRRALALQGEHRRRAGWTRPTPSSSGSSGCSTGRPTRTTRPSSPTSCAAS